MSQAECEFEWTTLPKELDPDAFVATLQVTPEEREEIASRVQRSIGWKQARCGRMTASNYGAAAGHHLPGAQEKLIRAMVWPEIFKLVGKAAEFAAWGTANEPVARDIYVYDRMRKIEKRLPGKGRHLRVYETGLLVSLEHGWLASSPDFVVEELPDFHENGDQVGPCANKHHSREPFIVDHADGPEAYIEEAKVELKDVPVPSPDDYKRLIQGCGEIKCPATKKLYSSMKKHSEYRFPRYYIDQIQGVMAINHWPFCDTVVYTPTETEVIRFHYDDHYWQNELFPALEKFYFKTFLPRLAMRARGLLRRGEVDPVMAPLPALLDKEPSHMELIRKLKLRARSRKAQVQLGFDEEEVEMETRHAVLSDPMEMINRTLHEDHDAYDLASMISMGGLSLKIDEPAGPPLLRVTVRRRSKRTKPSRWDRRRLFRTAEKEKDEMWAYVCSAMNVTPGPKTHQ